MRASIIDYILIAACFMLLMPHAGWAEELVILDERSDKRTHALAELAKLPLQISFEDIAPHPDLQHPFDDALLPSNIAPIKFFWKQGTTDHGPWLLQLTFEQGAPLTIATDAPSWEPPVEHWATIRQRAEHGPVSVRVYSFGPPSTVSETVSFYFSDDKITAPILYQQMPLPIAKGLKHPEQFQWLTADLSSSAPPRVVLENQKVCGMCHHVSADGSTFVMDLDIGKDKGAFVVADVGENVRLDRDAFHSWTGFQDDDKTTLGLFAKASPDGRFILATVQERNMFVALSDPEFSEVFFPIRSKLAYYSKRFDYISFLPGADDPAYAQTGGVFSPDGKTITFSRAPANKSYLEAMGENAVLKGKADETIDDYNKRYPIRFDIWQVPFNHGYGGEPVPVAGASNNGRSNYWPRYSPDGRFLVFTQADNGMMNQPGSSLMVVPANGGTARKLQCSLPRHNSWHSFSPDGKWLTFSSKVYGANTRLFLTHFDKQGQTTPPVFLHRLAEDKKASVIPEFVNIKPGQLQRIDVPFDTLPSESAGHKP